MIFFKNLASYIRSNQGATAIEYALIATGISIAIAAVVFLLGDELLGLYNTIVAAFTN